MFAFIVFLSCFGAFKKTINKSFLIFENKCAFSKHFIQTAPDIVLPAKACKPYSKSLVHLSKVIFMSMNISVPSE